MTSCQKSYICRPPHVLLPQKQNIDDKKEVNQEIMQNFARNLDESSNNICVTTIMLPKEIDRRNNVWIVQRLLTSRLGNHLGYVYIAECSMAASAHILFETINLYTNKKN